MQASIWDDPKSPKQYTMAGITQLFMDERKEHAHKKLIDKEYNMLESVSHKAIARDHFIFSAIARDHLIFSATARDHFIFSATARDHLIVSGTARDHLIVSGSLRKPHRLRKASRTGSSPSPCPCPPCSLPPAC